MKGITVGLRKAEGGKEDITLGKHELINACHSNKEWIRMQQNKGNCRKMGEVPTAGMKDKIERDLDK